MLSEDRRTIHTMRAILVLISMGLLLIDLDALARPSRTAHALSTPSVSNSKAPKAPVDFDTQLKPIFQSKCMPCHFTGGQMYERLTFDKPETIRKLGHRLFTRIKE